MTLNDETLRQYIKHVYETKYLIRRGGCLSKSIRIVKAARRLGHKASLMICISHPTHSGLFGWSLYFFHFYALVDGVKIDVSFDPETERRRMRNEDVEMTKGVTVPWI